MMKKTMYISLAVLLIFLLLGSILAFASNGAQTTDQAIFLHVGSPLLLDQGEIKTLDSENPDVAATVVQSHTLLPLRALSEYFQAKVAYQADTREAILEIHGKQYAFPINQKQYYVVEGGNRKAVAMDSKTVILNQRTMVPIRVICEDILNLKVSYYDRVIAIAEKEIDLQGNKELVAAVKSKIGTAIKAPNLKELKIALHGSQLTFTSESEISTAQNDMAEAKEAAPSMNTADQGSQYSATNTQVEGVDEADIVKTDGKYLYIAGGNAIRIVGADRGKLSDDAMIRMAESKYIQEIYVDKDRLILLGNRSEPMQIYPDMLPYSVKEDSLRMMPPFYRSQNYSFIDVYDISDPKRPVFVKGHEMEGLYQTSRKQEDVVYMITNTSLYGDILLPMMRDTVTGTEPVSMKLDDVMILPSMPSPGYIVVSALDIQNQEKTEVEAVAAWGSITYMNDHALYLASNAYDGTTITKLQINGTKVGYAGSGKVKGTLLNQFSMDEYDQHLRVATTDWNNDNGLYILDGSMNVCGSIAGLAENERIYSVRFMGDRGYVVTFRNMDPLFVFDLSDPTSPKLTGELKIPGFSNYLHPVGEDLLLGIGAETYEIYRKDENGKDVVIGNQQGGIKLSLFDVSEPNKPKEISKLVLGDSGSYTEAFYNHKAVMVDQSRKNIAFEATVSGLQKTGEYKQGAAIIGYDDKKVALKGFLDFKPMETFGKYVPYARRVLYIGDELYYIQDGRITSYQYENLTPIQSIELQ